MGRWVSGVVVGWIATAAGTFAGGACSAARSPGLRFEQDLVRGEGRLDDLDRRSVRERRHRFARGALLNERPDGVEHDLPLEAGSSRISRSCVRPYMPFGQFLEIPHSS